MTSWIDTELTELTIEKAKTEKPKLPPLTFEEGKITEIVVDFSQPFDKWYDEDNETYKAIIPITHVGIQKNWWLNVKNPFYHELLELGKLGVTTLKVIRTGQKRGTRYTKVD